MPTRAALGGIPGVQFNALQGFYAGVSLIAAASGNGQLGYIAGADDLIITAANGGNNAVTLPNNTNGPFTSGDWATIWNGTAQACVVFPFTGGQINALGVNASIALAAWTKLLFKCYGVNLWIGAP